MLKTNDIEKKSAKPCKTGVILVKRYFTVLPFFFFFWLNSSISITETPTKTRNFACIIHILLVACAQCCYISVNPFTSCVTDCYQLQQYNIIETETETSMKICMYKDFIMQMCKKFYIFVNPFTSCVTDCYLPQQYIIIQTIKRLAY